ncbi:MAG: alpha/beta hydrolase family protein, partial [Asticcacaulis sp.]
SYGGYAAQAGATIDHGVYNCAVSVAGLSDPQGFLHFIAQNRENDDSIYVRNERRLMGDPKHYDDISPLKQAANAYCPILLIHGTDDTVVPIDQSQRMERALKEAGKPVEFITYKGQDHWETMTSSRVAMMQSAMDFIGKHNPA